MTQGAFEHQPVLLKEVLQALAVKPAGIYLDGTFGRGGHAAAILAQLGADGKLIAMDQDPQAVTAAQERFAGDSRFEIVQGNFASLADVCAERGMAGKLDGVLLDLGVSSPQLDDASRGFSFMKPGPLDMRMNPQAGLSAAQWLAVADEKDIADVLWQFGEERFSRRIARAVVTTRQEAPITDTLQLAELVSSAVPKKEKFKHPATRSFQAIRIYVNQELDVLPRALTASAEVLAPGGRLAVISFHSLEDRIVKRFMRDKSRGPQLPKDLPVIPAAYAPEFRLAARAVMPGDEEIARNPRARSSVLRVLEKRV
jgi:16S rRNA (cytosine1402-N4)-methyltransferase